MVQSWYIWFNLWFAILLYCADIWVNECKTVEGFFQYYVECGSDHKVLLMLQSSSDQTTMDIMLPFFFGACLATYFSLLGVLFVLCQTAWPICFVLLPLGYVYLQYQVTAFTMWMHSLNICILINRSRFFLKRRRRRSNRMVEFHDWGARIVIFWLHACRHTTSPRRGN